jgi:hypothetical protein
VHFADRLQRVPADANPARDQNHADNATRVGCRCPSSYRTGIRSSRGVPRPLRSAGAQLLNPNGSPRRGLPPIRAAIVRNRNAATAAARDPTSVVFTAQTLSFAKVYHGP